MHSSLEALDLATRDYAEVFPNPNLILRRAREAGVVPADVDPRVVEDERERRRLRREISLWARDERWR